MRRGRSGDSIGLMVEANGQGAGVRLTAMEAARLVPVAGQLVAAGIGYWSVNAVAMRHIADCERIAAELQRPGGGI